MYSVIKIVIVPFIIILMLFIGSKIPLVRLLLLVSAVYKVDLLFFLDVFVKPLVKRDKVYKTHFVFK